MDDSDHYTSEERRYLFPRSFYCFGKWTIKSYPFSNTAAYSLCNFKLYYLDSIYLCGSLLVLRDIHLFKVWTYSKFKMVKAN